MAKTNKGGGEATSNPPADPNLVTQLEDTVAESISGIEKFFKENLTTLLVIAIALFASIPVYFVYQNLSRARAQAQSAELEEVFEGTPEEIRQNAPAQLKALKGRPLEVVLGIRYAQWLRAEDENNLAEGLAILEDINTRHGDDPFLTASLASFRTASEGSNWEAPPVLGPQAEDSPPMDESADAPAGE